MHKQCTNNCNVQRAASYATSITIWGSWLWQFVVIKDVATLALLKCVPEREGDDDKLSLVRSDCELKAQILTVKTRRATCTHLWHQLPRLRSPRLPLTSLLLLFDTVMSTHTPSRTHTHTEREERATSSDTASSCANNDRVSCWPGQLYSSIVNCKQAENFN